MRLLCSQEKKLFSACGLVSSIPITSFQLGTLFPVELQGYSQHRGKKAGVQAPGQAVPGSSDFCLGLFLLQPTCLSLSSSYKPYGCERHPQQALRINLLSIQKGAFLYQYPASQPTEWSRGPLS